MDDRQGHRAGFSILVALAALGLAFLAGRWSVGSAPVAPLPSREAVAAPGADDHATAERSPVETPVAAGVESAKPGEERRPAPAAMSVPTPSIDRGVESLTELLAKAKDPQAVREMAANWLQPTLDQALDDEVCYNPAALTLSSAERAKLDEWIDAFDQAVLRAVGEHEERKYTAVLERIRFHEQWVAAASEAEVAKALRDRPGTEFVVQTDFAGRAVVGAHFGSRFGGEVGAMLFSTGGSRDGTSRITAFREGDGSRVIETMRAIDAAAADRTRAIKDYLQRLRR